MRQYGIDISESFAVTTLSETLWSLKYYLIVILRIRM